MVGMEILEKFVNNIQDDHGNNIHQILLQCMCLCMCMYVCIHSIVIAVEIVIIHFGVGGHVQG